MSPTWFSNSAFCASSSEVVAAGIRPPARGTPGETLGTPRDPDVAGAPIRTAPPLEPTAEEDYGSHIEAGFVVCYAVNSSIT